MFLVTKEFVFDAAHFLPFYEGKCENLHGHTYKMQVSVKAKKQADGMAFDFVALKKIVQEEIISKWDHQLINDHIENPSAENMAEFVFEKLKKRAIPIFEVKIWETPTSFVSYRGGEDF
jgi:6-pyruvoyltetrahydropterin/6-carboxytetrahydropterin synthase